MNGWKILGALLLAAGILALVYGGFAYPKNTHSAKLGPVELEVQKQGRVHIPAWAGVAAAAVGGGLLAFGGKRR